MKTNNLKGSIILFITAIIWGTSFVAQSEGMKLIQPFTYNSIRTLIGGAVLVPVILVFRAAAKRSGDYKKLNVRVTLIGGICCGLALCIASSFQQVGIVYTTAGKSGFITALYVIIVPILELLLGRKQGKKIACFWRSWASGFYV